MPRMPALRHGVAVLRFLASKPGPVGAVAIARSLGLPRSSTYQILQVLAVGLQLLAALLR